MHWEEMLHKYVFLEREEPPYLFHVLEHKRQLI